MAFRVALEVFVQTAIFMFVCIAVSGLLAECRLLKIRKPSKNLCNSKATNNKVSSVNFEILVGRAVYCEILRVFTPLFRLVGNFDQLSIDFYLVISIRVRYITGVIGALQT